MVYITHQVSKLFLLFKPNIHQYYTTTFKAAGTEASFLSVHDCYSVNNWKCRLVAPPPTAVWFLGRNGELTEQGNGGSRIDKRGGTETSQTFYLLSLGSCTTLT